MGNILPYQHELLATSSEESRSLMKNDGGERVEPEEYLKTNLKVEPEDVRPSQFRDKYNGDVAVDQL